RDVRAVCRTLRPGSGDQWRVLPDRARTDGGPAGGGDHPRIGCDTEAGHRRRHLGPALHLPLLSGGRGRPGRSDHAPGRRGRAGGGTAPADADLPGRDRRPAGMIGAVMLAAMMGVLPGVIAHRKGRCFVDWWLYGTAFFAIALPHALLVPAMRSP